MIEAGEKKARYHNNSSLPRRAQENFSKESNM